MHELLAFKASSQRAPSLSKRRGSTTKHFGHEFFFAPPSFFVLDQLLALFWSTTTPPPGCACANSLYNYKLFP